MSKWEKLINRLYDLDPSLRYEELEKILISYGFEKHETKGGSSHITFRKQGMNPITIPRHSPLKKQYILLVKNAIEYVQYEKNGGNDNE